MINPLGVYFEIEKERKYIKLKFKSIKAILKKAWDYRSLCVRMPDNGNTVKKCFTCNKIFDPKELDAGHLVHHGNNASGYGTSLLDWDNINIQAQCHYCNRNEYGKLQARMNFTRKVITLYGDEAIDKIEFKKHQIWKPTWSEAENLLMEWKDKYEMLKLK